jgi:hypothetical protein
MKVIPRKDNRMRSNQKVIKVSNLKKAYGDVQAVSHKINPHGNPNKV